MVIERRAAPRFPLRILGMLNLFQGATQSEAVGHEIQVKDISLRGALLIPDSTDANGTQVDLQLQWPKGGHDSWILQSAGEIQAVRKVGTERGLVVVFRHPPILLQSELESLNSSSKIVPKYTPALFRTPRINESAFQAYKQLSQVQRYVQQHYSDDINIAKVARVATMEMTYFSAFFHKKVGITYQSWLRQYRISKAMALLTQMNRSISEVASDVGYPEVRTFERAFKKVTDLTPSGFRKLVRPSYLDALSTDLMDLSEVFAVRT